MYNFVEKKNDFVNKGYAIFDGLKYHNQLEDIIHETEWEYEGGINNDWHPKNNRELYNSFLYYIHQQITLDIVENMFSEYTIDKRRIWEGVNKDATSWHNDIKEGPNCFFLLYHSLMENDGFVYFRNKKEEWKFIPKPGFLIAVNCENNFEHRAEQSNNKRIQSSYYFYVKNF